MHLYRKQPPDYVFDPAGVVSMLPIALRFFRRVTFAHLCGKWEAVRNSVPAWGDAAILALPRHGLQEDRKVAARDGNGGDCRQETEEITDKERSRLPTRET